MPTPEPQQFLSRFGLALLLEAIGQVPGVGVLSKAALQAYLEGRPAADLSYQAQAELRRLAGPYADLLKAEADADPHTFDQALAATLDVINRHSLDAQSLVEAAELDPDRAARLTLEEAAPLLEILEPSIRSLVQRLITQYYRLLFDHREAILSLGVPTLRSLWRRLEQVQRYLQEWLSAEQRRAWARTVWRRREYNRAHGLRPWALRAEYRLVPYSGASFQRVCAELQAWALGLAEKMPPMGLRLYVGPGGAGKTRLLFEAGDALSQRGWRTAFLLPGALDRNQAEALLHAPEPILLILDYAANRQAEVETLVNALIASARTQPFALVLLERQTPQWWEKLTRPATDPWLSGRVESLRTAPGVEAMPRTLPRPEPSERLSLYQQACRSLAELAPQIATPALPEEPQPAKLPERPFFVLLLAYLNVAGVQVAQPQDEESILDLFWKREREIWSEMLQSGDLLQGYCSPAQLEQLCDLIQDLLALAGLGRRFPEAEALASFIESHPQELPRPLDAHDQPLGARRLAALAARLYPAEEGNILPTPPLDSLADDLLERRLSARPLLLRLAVPSAAEIHRAPREAATQTVRALEALTRLWLTPRRLSVDKVQGWIETLRQHLPSDLPRAYWQALETALPQASVPLRGWQAAIYQNELALTPATEQKERARLFNNLGMHLSALGRHEGALEATQEAVDLYRALARAQPAAFNPDLARSLNNLGNCLSALGRHEGALEATQEAVKLYRELARAQPAAFNPYLAGSLNNLGNCLSALGRHEGAIAAYREAIELDPKFATPWHNLAEVYLEQGRFDEARHALQERLRLQPDNTFAPLIALGVLTRHLGQAESDEHFRLALAQWDRAWRDRLQTAAGLLEGKAIALLCLGQKGEALSTLREALAQRCPGDVFKFKFYELLQTAPQPPNGIDEMIALLKSAL